MNHSEQINEIAKALASAQAALSNATKDATNPAFRSKYATLAAVIDAIRPAFAQAGISILQPMSSDENGLIVIETILMHSSGQYISERLAARPEKANAHGIGSIATYLRRYSLASLVSITQDDDDGNGATGKGEPNAKGSDVPAQPAKPPVTVAKNPEPPVEQEVIECKRIAASLKAAKTFEEVDNVMDDPFVGMLRGVAEFPGATLQQERIAKLDALAKQRIEIINDTPLSP
jgi:hypothetical protein